MNACWVLTIKPSLPNTCLSHADLQTECLVFDSFQKAKAVLRERLHGFAFSRNAMFDGEGKMMHLDKYIQNSKHEDTTEEYWEFMDNGWLTVGRLQAVQDGLTAIFMGDDVDFSVEQGGYDDGMLSLHVCGDRLQLMGWDDGPFNGYEPLICTNMFNMTQEGDYYLYLDDLFGQDNCSAELYVDLKKAEMT